MEFTLFYDGPLKANANRLEKHQIRCVIHEQLKTLWQRSPLDEHHSFYKLDSDDKSIDLNRDVGDFNFVPLVSSSLWLVCSLDIALLRPEPPDSIITQGGDIDNRLKTLFDSLRYPKNVGELPDAAGPSADQKPFFCLLEDDNLITAVSVHTDQLLAANAAKNDVRLSIRVTTRATRGCFANLGLV